MKFCKHSYFRRNGCFHRFVKRISLTLLILVVCLMLYMMVTSQLHVLDIYSQVQLHKCPACFGKWESACHDISSGVLKVQGNFFWKSESAKGVWYGVWNNLPVVVKQLGHRHELEMLDKEICLNSTSKPEPFCNVHENVWRSFLNPPVPFKSAVMQFMECPCEQFASLVETKLKNKMNVVPLDQKIMALTNLHFNQEFLFLQIFSKRYLDYLPVIYGACGRVVVVENVGQSLSSVLGRSWWERVTISLKLIQLARTFTRTEDNMALYMYDVVLDNFAVDKHGNVKLIDCEHVLIVDISAFNQTYDKRSEDFCAADHFQCLTFEPHDLCNGQAQDHNYYAICRNILSGVGGPRGLLHSPPSDGVNSALIKNLLYNCVYSKEISREESIDKLEKELHRYISNKRKRKRVS